MSEYLKTQSQLCPHICFSDNDLKKILDSFSLKVQLIFLNRGHTVKIFLQLACVNYAHNTENAPLKILHRYCGCSTKISV